MNGDSVTALVIATGLLLTLDLATWGYLYTMVKRHDREIKRRRGGRPKRNNDHVTKFSDGAIVAPVTVDDNAHLEMLANQFDAMSGVN